jgi:predicted MFS family arabinose efflux permease
MVVFVPPMSGVLAGALSWRAPFMLGGLAAIVAGVLVWVGTRPEDADAALHGEPAAAPSGSPDPAPTDSASPAGAPTAARPALGQLLPLGGPVLLAAYVLTFAVFFGRNALLNAYLPLLGGVALGLPPAALGLTIGALSLLSVGVVIAGGVLVDRFGRRAVLLPGLGLLLVAQSALLLVRDVETFYVIVLFQAVSFLLNALPPSLVGEALPRAYGGLGIAGYRLVADSAILTAPLVMGVALDYTGYTVPVLLLLAETLIAATVATVALRRGLPTRVLAQG